MSDITFFRSLNEPSQSANASSIALRMLDGLAFRYYWATEELREIDYNFRPTEDQMSAQELCAHLEALSKMIARLLGLELSLITDEAIDHRTKTLDYFKQTHDYLSETDLSALSLHEQFWNCFNGPLADALTHVGQLNAWRRQSGNPLPKVNFFSGKAPS